MACYSVLPYAGIIQIRSRVFLTCFNILQDP